jgi:hypothetical protein
VPRRGVGSPPGPELLGVVTSHEPSRESYTPAQKSSDSPAEVPGTAAAAAVLSAEGMRTAFPSATGATAVLQRAVPEGGAEVVAVEGAAEVPNHGQRETETQRPKRALPGARQ